jgi:hypothetical protein
MISGRFSTSAVEKDEFTTLSSTVAQAKDEINGSLDQHELLTSQSHGTFVA